MHYILRSNKFTRVCFIQLLLSFSVTQALPLQAIQPSYKSWIIVDAQSVKNTDTAQEKGESLIRAYIWLSLLLLFCL